MSLARSVSQNIVLSQLNNSIVIFSKFQVGPIQTISFDTKIVNTYRVSKLFVSIIEFK